MEKRNFPRFLSFIVVVASIFQPFFFLIDFLPSLSFTTIYCPAKRHRPFIFQPNSVRINKIALSDVYLHSQLVYILSTPAQKGFPGKIG